ncbi:MAG: hypothetical protein LN413_05625 [Candidatus Thermoplasmatota archaeon]|nr:hypothetical protein [Candidatus Thermoplasmatota archaeon]
MVTQGVADAIIILVVGVIAIQGVWLSLITYQMLRNLRRRRRKTEGTETRETYVEEVFLLQRSGTLLRHLTRRLKPYADSDILSGMLRAVQEFIRDAFKGESGELNEMSFGELKISIVSGQHAVLATMIRGDPPEDIIAQMQRALDDLERNHGDELRDWSGIVEEVPFVDDYLSRLLEGEYEEKGSKPAEKGEKVGAQLRRLIPLPVRRNGR